MSVQVGLGKQTLLAFILVIIVLLVIEAVAQILLNIEQECRTKSVYYEEYEENVVSQMCSDYKNIKYLDSIIRTNEPNQVTETYSINEYGFRGKNFDFIKKDDEYRIIMVGGSTTFGLGSTSDNYTIPAHLESILNEKFQKNIQVINAGVIAATSSSEVYYIKKHLIKFDPDLIIVFDGYNDAFNIKLDDINPEDEFASNLNLSPFQLFVRDNFKFFATPNLIFLYTYDHFQNQYLTNEIKIQNTQKWLERWNKTCNFSHENNFELFIMVQPMIGTSDRELTEIEKNIKEKGKYSIQYPKTFEFLNHLGDNIDSLSCPHADLRYTFDGIEEQVFHSPVHTGDKQNKIIANKIFEHIETIIQKKI